MIHLIDRSRAAMVVFSEFESKEISLRVLGSGQFFQKETFGPETVNRGAVLMECEWHGGVFESGIMMGGIFRGGQFRDGSFWGGVFWEGEWLGGVWECGFDRNGRYHPRTDHPPFA